MLSGRRKIVLILTLLGVFAITHVQAQIQSVPFPNFEVDLVRGCSPYSVTVKNLLPQGSDSIFYYFRNTLLPSNCAKDFQEDPRFCTNGEADTVLTQQTYTFEYINDSDRPEEFYIVQVNKNAPEGQQVSYINISTTIPSLSPKVDISICGDNTIALEIDYEADFYDYYVVDFGDGSPPRTVEKDTQTNILDHVYNFGGNYSILVSGMLSTGYTLSCGSTLPISINTIESAPEPRILNLTARDENSFNVHYEPLNPIFDFVLEVDFGDGFEAVKEIDNINENESLVIVDDRFDNLNDTYAFRIQGADNCSSQSGTSPIVHSISFQQFFLSADDFFNVGISYQTARDSFLGVDLYTFDQYKDSFNSNTADSLVVQYENCLAMGSSYLETSFNGAISRSLIQEPVISGPILLPQLDEPTAEFAPLGIKVSWPESHFPSSQYQVFRKVTVNDYKLIGEPSGLSWNDNLVPPSSSLACYVIVYEDECGNFSERSDEVCLPLVGTLKLPNAFSPNGDGDNDTFKPVDGRFENYTMLIFNRWGKIVYQSNDSEVGWNGLAEGEPAKTGTYMYKITYTDDDNIPITTTGTFVLIR